MFRIIQCSKLNKTVLPIYSALYFAEKLKGGGTHPWAVVVRGVDNKPEKFVVKLFKQSYLQQHSAVVSEVLGAVLAAEFELPHPRPALIEFTPAFIATLPEAQRKQLAEASPEIKFGCGYLESEYMFAPVLATRVLDPYDLETIYAFDNLILNVDRRPAKPNLLLTADEAYLIDHEHSFSALERVFTQLKKGRWEHNYASHLLYQHLRNQASRRPFDTFGEYLGKIKPQSLRPYYEQLTEFGHVTPNFDLLLEYLIFQKNNATQFVSLLRETLL
jgi:hypothetical protein